ncbi:MAG: hypothetical protein SGI77_14485 [Pirellulaceae bacterium]|nr:hypothetical protein [Pirellulaceae bacterium]
MSMVMLFTALLLAVAEPARPDTTKMNILMIDIEDCRADVWGVLWKFHLPNTQYRSLSKKRSAFRSSLLPIRVL